MKPNYIKVLLEISVKIYFFKIKDIETQTSNFHLETPDGICYTAFIIVQNLNVCTVTLDHF